MKKYFKKYINTQSKTKETLKNIIINMIIEIINSSIYINYDQYIKKYFIKYLENKYNISDSELSFIYNYNINESNFFKYYENYKEQI